MLTVYIALMFSFQILLRGNAQFVVFVKCAMLARRRYLTFTGCVLSVALVCAWTVIKQKWICRLTKVNEVLMFRVVQLRVRCCTYQNSEV